MEPSPSLTSPEVHPEQSYLHEHPLYTFQTFREEVKRFEHRIPDGMREYSYYLTHIMEESLISQTVNICFRNMDECDCLAARLGMCMHNIPESLKERLQIKADKMFGGRVSVLRSGMTDELTQ
jgi:hypothetical protein